MSYKVLLQFDRDLLPVQLFSTLQESIHHLPHNFVEEDVGQLGVEKGAKFKRDLKENLNLRYPLKNIKFNRDEFAYKEKKACNKLF